MRRVALAYVLRTGRQRQEWAAGEEAFQLPRREECVGPRWQQSVEVRSGQLLYKFEGSAYRE